MYLRKPGLSVSARETSDNEDSAMESIYSARSSMPRISPGICETGLTTSNEYFQCRVPEGSSHRPIWSVSSKGISSLIFVNSSCEHADPKCQAKSY